jgi:uncharacterized protein DUF1349
MRFFLFGALGMSLCGFPGIAGEKKPALIRGWGEVVDPAGDCKIIETDGKVSITVPGTQHNLNPLPGWNNLDAPRVLQEVEGDFTLLVKAARFEKPKPNTSSNKEKPASFIAGGIVIWQDGNNFLRFLRAANADRKDFDAFVAAEYYSEGKKIAGGGAKTSDMDTYLRVERKKGKFSLSVSDDGKSWTARKPAGKELTLQTKVKVGVAVINSTTAETTHVFSDLKLTKP